MNTFFRSLRPFLRTQASYSLFNNFKYAHVRSFTTENNENSTEATNESADSKEKKRFFKLAFIDLVRNPAAYKNRLYDPADVDLTGKNICVVYDNKPKAKKHLLVLPTMLVQQYKHLNETHIPLIEEMKAKALQVIDEIKSTPEGKDLTFKIGFLAKTPMLQIHLHIISDDFESPYLINRRQWNSFHGINFVHPDQIIEELKTNGAVTFDHEKYSEALKANDTGYQKQ